MAKSKKKQAPIGFGRKPDDLDDDTSTSGDSSDEFRDPSFDELMDQLREQFMPAESYEEAGLRLTTKEVYDRLQVHYPSTFYSPTTVYHALRELGFKSEDPFRDLSYIWLFK